MGIRQEDNDTNRAVPEEVKQLIIVERPWSPSTHWEGFIFYQMNIFIYSNAVQIQSNAANVVCNDQVLTITRWILSSNIWNFPTETCMWTTGWQQGADVWRTTCILHVYNKQKHYSKLQLQHHPRAPQNRRQDSDPLSEKYQDDHSEFN